MSSAKSELRNSHFYCPITDEVMRDPVIDPEGNSYERDAITSWLANHDTSPITRTHLTIEQLIPNRSLRKAIEDEQAMVEKEVQILEEKECVFLASSKNDAGAEQVDVSLCCVEGSLPRTLDLLVSISPPADVATTRSGCDICCVVDVSGSMGGDASIPGAENSGLSLLDITKHALKTVISSLQDSDRLSLVSYSNAATVVCGLTPMSAAGRARAIGLVDTLQADGMTNLWDGLKTGLDTLTEAASVSGVRNAAVFLLTDGEPNVEPPRGHIPMLKLYREKNQGRFPGSISTFGFGYSVKSQLLREIADVGGGMYAFIPDSGFVGTAFVNALANQLATMCSNASLSVELPEALRASLRDETCILGQANCSVTSWGAVVDVGNVKYGQKKDVVFRLALPEGVTVDHVRTSPEFLASFSYTPLTVQQRGGGAQLQQQDAGAHVQDTVTATAVSPPTAENMSYVSVQTFRSEVVVVLAALMQAQQEVPELAALIASMQQWLTAHPKSHSEAYSLQHYALVEGMLKDLTGQVSEAIQSSYFKKWGRHFLPSLARAHQLQECLNFKDPGVQLYGGQLFQAQRNSADEAFNQLPPPKSGARIRIVGAGAPPRSVVGGGVARAPSAVVCMSNFNSASAPCFHGNCLVRMGDGSVTSVAQITRGDRVLCNTHVGDVHGKEGGGWTAEVQCVVQTLTNTGRISLVHFAGGLQVTPYHPIFAAQQVGSDRSWHFPADNAEGKLLDTTCDSVFSFVLGPVSRGVGPAGEDDVGRRAESMVINDTTCITLAHGILEDAVAAHEFYGSERVVESLREVDSEGLEGGRVVLQEGCVLKDPATGRACGFRTGSNSE